MRIHFQGIIFLFHVSDLKCRFCLYIGNMYRSTPLIDCPDGDKDESLVGDESPQAESR